MANKDHWRIKPTVGLGLLTFGASLEEVGQLDQVYGPVIAGGSVRIPDELVQDTIDQFGADLTDEERQEILDTYAALGPSAGRTTQVRGNGLVLDYEDDALVEITLSAAHGMATFEGVEVFAAEPQELLEQLERANGGPGRYRSTEAAFDALAIAVSDFSEVRSGRTVTVIGPLDERHAERTLGIKRRPFIEPTERDQFVRHSWIADAGGSP